MLALQFNNLVGIKEEVVIQMFSFAHLANVPVAILLTFPNKLKISNFLLGALKAYCFTQIKTTLLSLTFSFSPLN